MIRVSDSDERLIRQRRRQAHCAECLRYPEFSGRKRRRWYWESEAKETLCEVCPECGIIRRFDADILMGR